MVLCPRPAGAALLAHDRVPAGRLRAGGTGTWALPKLVRQTWCRSMGAGLTDGPIRRYGRGTSGDP